jgi:hypothetical protein
MGTPTRAALVGLRGQADAAGLHLSFVVDRSGAYGYQAYLLVRSLTAFGGMRPDQISAFLVEGTDPLVEECLRDLGVRTGWVEPFGHPYCNRIQSFDALAHVTARRFALKDTDMFVVRDLAIPASDAVMGKVVDTPLPPLKTLQVIFDTGGLSFRADRSNVIDGPTARGNMNAGFIVIPDVLMGDVGAAWAHWARWCIDRIHLFERWHVHVDQVSLALALADLRLPLEGLPFEYNVPTHLPVAELPAPPRILHYHRAVEAFRLLRPNGAASVADAVDVANEAIRRWRTQDRDQAGVIGRAGSSGAPGRARGAHSDTVADDLLVAHV